MKFFSYLILVLLSCGLPIAMALPLAAEQKIPDCLLSYNFGPEQYVVVVEKSTQSLYIYSNYNPEPVDKFTVTTGKQNGQKDKEGDLKTPEGIYFFRRILAGQELPKVEDYGEKAFTLSYPNPIDSLAQRNGSGIWLHGAYDEGKTSAPNNSKGCIVLKNQDLIKVSKYIFLNQTPICIYEKIRYDAIENIQKKRDRLINDLKEWKDQWENKNTEGYIGYYDTRFRSDGMNREQFKIYKDNLNSRYKYIRVFLSDINIYGFDDYHVVSFNQLYISDLNHFNSRKIQYWTDSQRGDNAKILAEMTSSLPQPSRVEISKGNFISIEQFRRSYVNQVEVKPDTFVPVDIRMEKVSISGNNISLTLKKASDIQGLKVVPVLRFEHPNGTEPRFRSLAGITLNNGTPQDYSKAAPLDNRQTILSLEKESGFQLKSLTLMVVDGSNRFKQIITYYIDN